MSVLVFIETENNTLKRNAAEVASYGVALATFLNTSCKAIVFHATNPETLGQFGIKEVTLVSDAPTHFDAHAYAEIVAEHAQKNEFSQVVVSSSADAKYLAPILAVKLQAAYVPNVVNLPQSTTPLSYKRAAFTNKAFAYSEVLAANSVIGVSNNSFGVVEKNERCAVVPSSSASPSTKLEQLSIEKVTGKATIADADVVVSGGRGLKGPENWHLVEALADVLGAATACSKPVSDMGWRSHDEHVGQTGKPVSTNLYIAIGISGAIQHLAGVNSSKVKVVINNDPEAPFFKAADYGVVGDAFEVVPKLTQKLKEFKA
jgi:electron transfer flavoprotein alpha subunit